MKVLSSLRSLLVVFVVAAIAPLVVFSVAESVFHVNRDLAKARQNIELTATAVAHTQERVADSARQMLISISKVPDLVDQPGNGCGNYLKSLNKSLPAYTNIGLISAEGYMLCNALPEGDGVYMGDRSFFQAAIARDSLVASGYLVGRLSKKPVVVFALPVKNAQGQITAVAFVALGHHELAKAVGDIKLPAGKHLIIMDRTGVVLAENTEQSTAIGQQVGNPLLKQAIQSGTPGVFEGADVDGVQKIYALAQTTPASDSAFWIAVGLDKENAQKPAYLLMTLELVVLMIVSGLGCLLAWGIGGRAIMKPTLEVLEAIRNIQAGRLDVRIPIAPDESNHEFTKIANGFNLMAETIQQREIDLMLEIQRSEQAWETLDTTVNSLKDGLIFVGSDAQILFLNNAATQIFTLDPAITPLSDKWPQQLGLFVPGTEKLYAREELPLYKALLGQTGGPQRIFVKNSLVPQGQLISASYRPMTDGEGQTGGLMVFSDITELDKLHQEQTKNYLALRDSQRQLLDAQRLGRIGHWQMNPVTHAIFWSDELYKLFGQAPGSFDGRHETFLQWVHPADRARYAELRETAVKNNQELDIEYRIVTPDGQTRWMHQLGQTHVNQAGHLDYRAGVVQEITERKQAELALAHTVELLNRTGELAMVGGWEIDLNDMRLEYSDQTYRIYDLLPGAPISADAAKQAYPPEARLLFEAAVKAAVKNCTPWDLELPSTTRSGRSIWVRTQGQAIRQGNKTVKLVGAVQDITAQRKSREQLRLLETCVSRLNDMVLITDVEAQGEPGIRIVFVNDAFERQTGYSREEVLGQSPRILQGPNTQRSELDRIGVALKNWQPVRAELINYTKSGKEFWIELDIVPVADNVGWFTHWVAVARDITQRKLAEQAMSDSEQRYAALFEQAPVPMWVFSAENFQFLAVNNAAINDYGYSTEEFQSMSVFDIRSNAEDQNLKNYLMQESLDSSPRWEHRRKDGSVFMVRGLSRPIQYAGKAARFGVALDVSAQVQAENEVRDYLVTLERAALANQTIALHLSVDRLMDEVALQARCVIGTHQAVVSLCEDADWANATHVFSLSDKHTGYGVEGSSGAQQPHKLLSMGGTDIYASVGEKNQVMRLTQAELESHPDWRNAAGFALQKPTMRGWLAIALIGRNGKKIGLLQLSDKFKGDFTLQDEFVATELAQFASIAIENAKLLEEVKQLNAGLEHKVTERTAALARQEALFRELADQAPQVIWTADTKGHVTYLNRAWFDLMGGHLRDWDGLKWFSVIHPEDLPQVQANWVLAMASQTPYFGVRRMLDKNGSFHAMSYRASPVFNADGSVDFWVGIDADVTEIKAIEEALRLSNQELEAFSYSVSHDLRSPLNTIDGFSRLLAKQLGTKVSDKERHYLSRVQAGVAQMGQLIEDLLSLAQVSRKQLHYEKVDLSVICRHICGEWQARHPDREVAVHIENELHAHGDHGLIRIVLENLLGNALKFTSHLAHATIRVGQKTDAAGLPVFFISDNGAGFDMAYADKLFVAFQRLHLASEFPGTGIGLATVSRAIARQGGRLWAEAAVGKGATFFFTLPR